MTQTEDWARILIKGGVRALIEQAEGLDPTIRTWLLGFSDSSDLDQGQHLASLYRLLVHPAIAIPEVVRVAAADGWFQLAGRMKTVKSPDIPSEFPAWYAQVVDLLHGIRTRSAPQSALVTYIVSVRIAAARTVRQYHHVEEGLFECEVLTRGDPDLHAQALVHLHSHLCYQGMARTVPGEDLEAAYALRGQPGSLNRLSFIDAIEAGRLDEAHEWRQRNPGEPEGLTLLYHGLLAIFDSVRCARTPNRAAIDSLVVRFEREGQSYFAANLRDRLAIVLGDTAYMREHCIKSPVLTSSQWLATVPIEAALALDLHEEAAAMLRLRAEHGLDYPVDEVLRARLQAMTGEADAAAVSLSAACLQADRCGGLGRIELQLAMASELAPTRLFQLGTRLGQVLAPRLAVGGGRSIIGESAAMVRVRALIERFAGSDLPVLVTGPTGCGKELVVRALHESSQRRRRPLVICNCAAIAEGLLESELFGHAKGAFSGAAAAREGLVASAGDGTLVLDEIGEASQHFQAALLRLLDYQEYRPVGSSRVQRSACRFVCSTNVELRQAVADGRFREDLYYRLKRLEIHLPPLAERPEDIMPIASSILLAMGRTCELAVGAWLRARPWPGNVRELRGLLERAATIDPSQAPLTVAALIQSVERDGQVRVIASEEAGTGAVRRRRKSDSPAVPAVADAAAGSALERRLDRVLTWARGRSRITRREMCAEFMISPATASNYLTLLVDRGVLRRITPTAAPSSHYFEVTVG